MQVSLHSIQVLSEHVHLVDGKSFLLAFLLSNSEDALKVLGLVELRYIARVEYVVDIFKHLLLYDLSIHEQERGNETRHTALHQAEFKVVSPVVHVVSFHYFNVVKFEVTHESGQLSQGLTSRTTDTEQESVTHWLPQNSADSVDVITGIQEHDKLHLHLTTRVEVLEVFIDLFK